MKTKLMSLVMVLGFFALTVNANATRLLDSKRWHDSGDTTFSALGTGTTMDLTGEPGINFTLQNYQSDGAAATYSVVLEGSLDGANFTTILSGSNGNANLSTWTTTGPIRFARLRAAALASNHTFHARFISIQ